LNGIQIQFKINKLQIGAQGIENMFIIAIIYNYGVEKKSIPKKHLSTPLKLNSKLMDLIVILVGKDN
jgi:hypothetical protein